ncbi:MAG TPA: hypothetical protein VGH54_05600 [Mycobacterium sp.]|jgi:hypothetical protein|uniref:hypothetical protein n=1 Tax=Mycobacterium sp. TaxID=1785 RepID=UPI002F40A7E3
MTDLIPDEAFESFTDAWNGWADPKNREGRAVNALAAAAPFIARAAQVAILRQMAAEIDGKHAIDAADLRAKADELEGGG